MASTVIFVVFVSFGCFFFLAFLSVALCSFIKKIQKKKMVQKINDVRVDEHMKIKEATVSRPHGAEAVIITMEDDVHIEKEMTKNEKLGQEMHEKSAGIIANAIEVAGSSSSSGHQHSAYKPSAVN